jgi:hypothetical protein
VLPFILAADSPGVDFKRRTVIITIFELSEKLFPEFVRKRISYHFLKRQKYHSEIRKGVQEIFNL